MENRKILLDIDMDYFVSPIQKVSFDNIRLYYDSECLITPVNHLSDNLKNKKIIWKNNIHCFTNHKKSYTYWWIDKPQNAMVIHIDAHSDLYRNTSCDLRRLPNNNIQCYNYLWYAIRDCYVNEIFWIIPSEISNIIDIDYAKNIININLIKQVFLNNQVLTIIFECICINNERKTITLHVCTIDNMPLYNITCDFVTIATSPEFIPQAADNLIFELFNEFSVDFCVCQNIYNQHKDLLNKKKEEIESARMQTLNL